MDSRTLNERTVNWDAERYWSRKMSDWASVPPIQPDELGRASGKGKDRIAFSIREQIAERMDRYCKERADLRFICLLSVMKAVLYAMTPSLQDIALAVPDLPESDDGMQGRRTIPIRTRRPEHGAAFKQMMKMVHETVQEGYKHQWHRGQESDQPIYPKGYNSFIFIYEPLHGRELILSSEERDESDIIVSIQDTEQGAWRCIIDFNAELYSHLIMQALSDSFLIVLEQASLDTDLLLTEVELRSPEEIARQWIWNDTSMPYETNGTFHSGFQRIAARLPDGLAVVTETGRLTYRELDARSDSIARLLLGRGARQGDRIAVMLDRSTEWIAAFIGVLKAGCTYIPVDPDYPLSRIEYMLQDSQAAALIYSGQRSCAESFRGLAVDVDQWEEELADTSGAEELPLAASDDLAYLLYTSGSTGFPKGVMVEHRGLANLQAYFQQELGITPQDRIVQFASSSFDASIWETAMALLLGAELHIATPDMIGDMSRFQRWMREHEVTVATLPPTYAVYLEPEGCASLRMLITAGSESNLTLLQQWQTHTTYINAYGPTETTVCATAWNSSLEQQPASSIIPIGKPLPNMQVWIVNEALQPLPAGVAGELCVAGAGLARGYWNKPELTDERFVALPIGGTRVYRTGDLARWTGDGNIAFLGRIDHQVKIRGYRIETDEVRHVLINQPRVKDAVVAVKPDEGGEPALFAYYVIEGGEELPPSELRDALTAALPGHMVPTYWARLEVIPLTPNGKPDLKTLPSAGDVLARMDRPHYQLPQGGTELELAKLWEGLLGARSIGRGDHFFQIGGHSMKAAKLASMLHRTFGVNMPLEKMFHHPTLEEMASWIDGERSIAAAIEPIPPAPLQTGYRLSPAQQRVFTIESGRNDSTLYILPFAFWLEGELEAKELEAAFRMLIQRHEPLRTSFSWNNGEPVQVVHGEAAFHLEQRIEEPANIASLSRLLVRPFDLKEPPLLRAALVDITDGRRMLFLQLHHIIADGLSLAVLMNDLTALLEERELPPLAIQYKDYSEWLAARESSEQHGAFWEQRFSAFDGAADLPVDYPRPRIRRFEGETLSYQWDKTLADSIRALAQSCDATLHVTMLAAYYVLLSKVTGKDDWVVGSLHAGRDHPEAMDMVGMFVHTLAHRNQPRKEMTFRSFTAEVKRRMLEDYEHAEYPFEQLVRQMKLHDTSRNPLFDTMFVLQNLEVSVTETDRIRFIPYTLKEEWTRFDLVFQAWENGDGLLLWTTYASALFRESTIEKLAGDYKLLLETVAGNPDIPIRELDLVQEYRPITASKSAMNFQF
ncbi:amino acid adenylation domain-containing protein [Paenibacillus oenotherae]|uniref:Amino acid adenylation domain-containing protein n=1 Tax=Paenibacillus oenotherae TaxID=1435645 RepID=A0ABS7D9C0_9BACL|nr:non-ribosomal peptide synthetase [Paenibacillus oenotherae]MBW7476456.1 amino acid adenylation domain-containing protein [Paenibacillus oenotherae]